MILFVKRIYLHRIHHLFLDVDSNRTRMPLFVRVGCFIQNISCYKNFCARCFVGYVRSTISKSEHKISKRDRDNILVRGMTSIFK